MFHGSNELLAPNKIMQKKKKKTHMQISHDPGQHDPDPGPQEKSTMKSCISFETQCKNQAG